MASDKAQQLISLAKKNSKMISVGVLVVIGLVFDTTAYRSTLTLAGLIIPLFYFNLKDFTYLLPVIAISFLKIFLTFVMDPDINYATYLQNDAWMFREPVTLILCYAWLVFGRRHVDPGLLLNLKPKIVWILLVIAYACVAIYEKSLILSGVSNLHILLFLIFYCAFTGNYSRVLKFSVLMLVLGTALIPRQSSFTVIASFSLVLFFFLSKFRVANITLPWRPVAIVCICFLMASSTFAYLVHVRATRATGEGNNGYTRSLLAEDGYNQFMETPVLGTPYGRGILPFKTIQNLGWTQYFTDTETFNIYNLSFHDSFIYLLTRYGLLSLFLFYMLVRLVPQRGRLMEVLYSCVFLLAAGANVVMESLRAGPGFGFALGVMLAIGQYQYDLLAKEKAEKPQPVLY